MKMAALDPDLEPPNLADLLIPMPADNNGRLVIEQRVYEVPEMPALEYDDDDAAMAQIADVMAKLDLDVHGPLPPGAVPRYTADDLNGFIVWGGVSEVTLVAIDSTVAGRLVGITEDATPHHYTLQMEYQPSKGDVFSFTLPFDATRDAICVPE